MQAHLLTADLAISSHVAPAAAGAGVELQVSMDIETLCQRCAANETSLVILDLNFPNLRPAPVVERLRIAGAPTVIAFGPHVHSGKLSTAREAGCDQVYTRGQFHSGVAEIFKQYLED